MTKRSTVVLSLVAIAVTVHFGWQEKHYDCENTGKFKTAVVVFGVRLKEVVEETETSRWFASEFGPSVPTRWHHYATSSILFKPKVAYQPLAPLIFEKCRNHLDEPGIKQKIHRFLFEPDPKIRFLAAEALIWGKAMQDSEPQKGTGF